VAAQTGVESFLGSDYGKRDDSGLAAVRIDVGFARSVATLAAGIFGRFLTAGDAFEMRIAEELVEDRRVAGLAGFTANEIGGWQQSGQKKGGRNHPKQRHYFNLTVAAIRSFAGS
jgi:hypothetical protein